jgi:uncharacterized protein (UPF0333 family)
MKRFLIFLVALAMVVPFARAQEQQAKQKKKKRQQQEETQATAKKNTENRSAKAQQTNPYLRKRSTTPGASGNYTKAKAKNNTVVVKNKTYRPKRKFVVTTNQMSFADARRWNWHVRHERDWWRSHNYRLVRYGGGYWYWNNGWWYPAYGYDPFYSRYVYDGPIYGYGYVNPWDVTAEVQRALAAYGYYYGPIDGVLGPRTRNAIERYQIDHRLAVTAAIDQRTLISLGLT